MSKLCKYILSLVIAQAGLAASDSASSVQQRFAEVQGRFEAAQAQLAHTGPDSLEARRAFREAAEQFAALADCGVTSANLYVNAGNAFHFAGNEPRALLWYLRAEQLAHTPEILSGLATLRRVCKADPWPPPRPSIGRVLMFWHYDLGHRPKQWLLLVLYPIGCTLVIISFFARRRNLWLRTGLALMLVGGIMGFSDAVTAASGGEKWAVVLAQAKGLSGDGPMYSTLVESVTPGQEVRLIELRRDWLQVELPSGTRCWLSADLCEPVSPLKHTPAHAS